MPVTARTYAALFTVSFAALMTEVALTRLFSFSIWYHFAYMTISVALLGYGAAGSAYYAFPALTRGGAERALGYWATAGGAFLLACLWVVSNVPFDPARLFPFGKFNLQADPMQLVYLTVFYLAVTLPFFAAGLCITIVLSSVPGRIPQLYFADLVGAAAGCLAAVVLLAPLGAPGVVALGAILLVVAGVLFSWEQRGVRVATAVSGCALLLAAVPLTQYADPRPSHTKFLSRLLTRNQSAKVMFSKWSPVYRVDVIGGRDGRPLRFGKSAAWGVSDRFPGSVPENRVITHDGDASTMLYKFDGNFDSLKMLRWSVLALPYLLTSKPDVLVIGAGGGVDILTGLMHGARHITGIELNPVTVRVLRHDFADYTGRVFERPDVTLLVDEGRNFVRRSSKEYDLIQITGIDTLAAVYSGAYVLSESYLYTREAIEEYVTHLTPQGILAIVRGDAGIADMPPRQILRLLSVMVDALDRLGVANPADHIMVVMSKPRHTNMPIFSILLQRLPFEEKDVARIREHSAFVGFEPWYLPGQKLTSPAAQFLEMSADQRAEFLKAEWLNLYPTTDDKPFFFNFLKWSKLFASAGLPADYTFASGQMVLLAILAQSAFFGFALIVAPLLRVGFGQVTRERLRYLTYFACLGLGFMFIEISYIQRFTLFLGSPVFSLSVILFTVLLSSGVGSYLSGQLRFLADPQKALIRLLAILCLLNVLYIVGLPKAFQAALGQGLGARIALTVLLLAPAGLVMGAFLPVGMRVLSAREANVIPWAWAANGVASVVGSILTIVLAISIGFRAVNIIALAVYAIGVVALLGPARLAAATTR